MTPKREGPDRLPDPLHKREVLYAEGTPPEELTALGKRFEEEGLPMDALDFYAQARSRPDLERLGDTALDQGDFFVYRRCALALARTPSPDQWRRLAENARRLGKEAFARHAEVEAGDRDATPDH